ncbi:alpha-1-acid glycoprotein 8-like [Mus caroli]|uniref:Alpha-1-acid glycoprotein 8-like n=1 Tax=Mus caroli TaxID=10089 RepID=A0A6P5PLR2_MUSCR|nr:alpha-1-acid glycoprotein 8-like [Mus caroli]
MALHTVLIMLSLLPMLEAQNPEHANITIGEPITNETLGWLVDKWFLIAVAVRNPELQHIIQEKQTQYFYLTLNLMRDKMLFQEYFTTGGQCENDTNYLEFQRENGALSLHVQGEESFAHLIAMRKHGAFMVASLLKDEKKRVLVLYAKEPNITPELREVFQKAVKHVGMDESEIIFVDWKKDKCG